MEVTWIDAYFNVVDEVDMADLDKKAATFGTTMQCQDIGYLVRKTAREVVLATSRCPADNTIRHSNTIPAGWVRSIVYLTPAAPEPTVEAPSNEISS